MSTWTRGEVVKVDIALRIVIIISRWVCLVAPRMLRYQNQRLALPASNHGHEMR